MKKVLNIWLKKHTRNLFLIRLLTNVVQDPWHEGGHSTKHVGYTGRMTRVALLAHGHDTDNDVPDGGARDSVDQGPPGVAVAGGLGPGPPGANLRSDDLLRPPGPPPSLSTLFRVRPYDYSCLQVSRLL